MQKRNKTIYKTIRHYYQEIKKLETDYIPHSKYLDIKETYQQDFLILKKNLFFKIFFHNINKHYYNLQEIIDKHNNQFIHRELKNTNEFFSNICGYPLDEEQRTAVITDDNRNLIVAGAGSGKTLTIIGKIHYLITKKNINPEDILCISFTNEAVKSLKKKISDYYNYQIEVVTFHKLGLNILKKASNSFRISKPEQLSNTINQYFSDSTMSETSFNNLFKYFETMTKIPQQLKVKNYKTLKQICTLDKENVRDKNEVLIANYLYLKGINYSYKRTSYGCIFHLLKEHKYIIYYNFYNPSYTIDLLDTFIDKSSIIITTFHDLQGQLDYYLKHFKIESKPLDKRLLYVDMLENDNDYLQLLKSNIETFINIFKSNVKSVDEIINTPKLSKIDRIFIYIFKEVYTLYQEKLTNKNEIDFNDIIHLATRQVDNISLPYRYIFIDEFQDTSLVRYRLIDTIQKNTKAKLIAVGDDFQSIYRFSGSNVDLFINFKKHFGYTKVLKIQSTYRNSQELIKLAGSFIMKNPNQIKKEMHSSIHEDHPICINYYKNFSTAFLSFCSKMNNNQSWILLIRNKQDIKMFENEDVKIKDNYIIVSKYKIKIPYMTIHKSKGLEFDYVIVINLIDTVMGFPSKIASNPLLNIITPMADTYPYEEERRLFYVAITRARKKVYLFTPYENKSLFIKEIEHSFPQDYDTVEFLK